jgi:hypothetical protein
VPANQDSRRQWILGGLEKDVEKESEPNKHAQSPSNQSPSRSYLFLFLCARVSLQCRSQTSARALSSARYSLQTSIVSLSARVTPEQGTCASPLAQTLNRRFILVQYICLLTCTFTSFSFQWTIDNHARHKTWPRKGDATSTRPATPATNTRDQHPDSD